MELLLILLLLVKPSFLFDIPIWSSTTQPSASVRHILVDENTTTETPDNYDDYGIYGGYGDYGYNYYGYHYAGNNAQEMSFEIIDEYLNMTETKQFLLSFHNTLQREIIRNQLRYCPYVSLCSFSFGLVKQQYKRSCCLPCSCDFPTCLKFQTCCPDILNSSMFHLDFKTEHHYASHKFNGIQDEPLNCTLLHAKRKFNFGQNSKYLHANCPPKSNSTHVEFCTRMYTSDIAFVEDMIPVTHSGQMITYRNKYCAFCNGIVPHNIEFWNVSLSCNNISKTEISSIVKPEKLLVNFVMSFEKCDLGFFSKYSNNCITCKSAISLCNETGLWADYDAELELSCSLYISNVKAYSMVFRNVFCLLCNGYEARIPTKVCDDRVPGAGSSFSFSGLIKRVSPRDETKEKYDATCNESSIFDTVTRNCRPIICNELYSLQNGKCVQIFDSIIGVTYNLFLRLVPLTSITVSEVFSMTEDILDSVRTDLFSKLFPETITAIVCGTDLFYRANLTLKSDNVSAFAGERNLLSKDVRFKLLVGLHDPYKFAKILNSIGMYNISLDFESRHIIFKIIVQDDGLNLAYDIVHILSDFSFGQTFTPLQTLVHYAVSDTDGITIIPYIRYKTNFCTESREFNAVAIRECTMVKLAIKSHLTNQENYTNTFSYSNFSFLQPEFNFESNTTITVCVDAFLRFLEQKTVRSAETVGADDTLAIVSIICISISIVCLSITLFTFAFFPSLRTFPGMNTVSLSLFLLLAQSFYLAGSFSGIESETVWCKVLGMLIHFFWLNAIIWMNICTFHMFRVLTHTRARSVTKLAKFVCYHIYAFALSSACIVINIGFSLYFSESIGYGQNICYISSEIMKTYTFGIPVLMVILANVVMFSAVIISIKRKASIHQTSSVERNDFMIFIKLSSLTGFTWLFGFIFYWTELPVFSYLFTILNSSQGVFLMLSFVMNKRILNLYKISFRKFGKPRVSGSGTKAYHVHGATSNSSEENCKQTRPSKQTGSTGSSQMTSL